MSGTHDVNRRKFLQQAAAAAIGAAGLPLFIPARALGRDGNTAPSDRIAIGCIGVGSMGTANMESFLGKGDARVVAVCDVDAAHRKAAADAVNKKYASGDCAQYEDFRELIARPGLDAVSIAVPDHWHAIIATSAAAAGLDIYAEKPLAYTISEGRAIVNAVKRHARVWQTGSWQRSQRHFRFGCELVRNGRIGKVHTVRVGLPYGNGTGDKDGFRITKPPEGFNYDMWLGPAPWAPYCRNRCHWNFRWVSDYSGGQLTDWAGHHCDIAHWGMGTELSAPVEIEGRAEFPAATDGLYDTADGYRFEARYREGFTMIVADRTKQPKGMGVQFEGEGGWVYVDRSGIDASPKSLLTSVIGPDEVHLYVSDDHQQNFLDCVRSRSAAVAPVETAHHSIMVGHLGLIAMKLGRKVAWNPDKERFVNDPAADSYLSRPMRSPWGV